MLFQFPAMFKNVYNDAKKKYILICNKDNGISLSVQISYLWLISRTVFLEQKQGLLEIQKQKQCVREIYILQTTETCIPFFFYARLEKVAWSAESSETSEVWAGMLKLVEMSAVFKNVCVHDFWKAWDCLSDVRLAIAYHAPVVHGATQILGKDLQYGWLSQGLGQSLQPHITWTLQWFLMLACALSAMAYAIQATGHWKPHSHQQPTIRGWPLLIIWTSSLS